MVALYLVAAALTAQWAPNGMRPVFDGFGSHPGEYNWVNPPKEFAEGNQRPVGGQANVTISTGGSGEAGVSTEDGQALASIVPNALPPHPPDSSARLDLRPVDSTRLGPLPAGLRPEGNAYRVGIVYLPSQRPVRRLAKPGTIGLTAAAPGGTLLFSADGKVWREEQGRPVPQGNGLTGPFTETGYYLVAGSGEPRAASTGSGQGAPAALYVVAALVPLVLGYLLIGRSRRAPARGRGRSAPAGAGRATAARRPPKRKAAKGKPRKR